MRAPFIISLMAFSLNAFPDSQTDHDYDYPEEHIAAIEQARKVSYENQHARLASLNYLRLKLVGIQSQSERLTTSFNLLRKACSPATFRGTVCKSGLDKLYNDTSAKISNLIAVRQSSAYAMLIASEINQKIRIQDVIEEQDGRLRSLSGLILSLRGSAGQLSAKLDFAKAQSRIRQSGTDFDLVAVCEVEVPRLETLFWSVDADLRHASVQSDAYLVVRALHNFGAIQDRIRFLGDQCSGVSTVNLQKLLTQIDVQRWQASVSKFVKISCSKLPAFAEELRTGCDRGVATEDFAFALHQSLRGAQ